MSDPISVTGTAVGVVSMGLQVCGEIVSYCQAWRGFDEDIQNFSQKADGLQITLQVLHGLLENFQTIDIATSKDIEEKLQQIEEVIKRLKEAIARFATKGPGGTAAIRAQFKKATYPFRKDGLREMSSDLDSLQLSLNTILHALSIQHAIQHTRTLITIQQATAQNIHHMNSSIEDIRKLFLLPVRSQNLCQDHHSQVAVLPGQSLIRRDYRSTDSSYQLCSNINFKRHNKATTKDYSHSIRILRLAINFTLSVTMGTAGLSIAPSLRLQPLRDASSSRLLETLKKFFIQAETYMTTPNDMEDLVTATVTQIQNMFDEGEATPFDIYINSNMGEEISILDFTCLRLGYSSFIASSRLLRFLTDCGASPGRPHGVIADRVSWRLSFSDMCEGEHEIGGPLFDLYGYNLKPPNSLAQREGLRWLIRQNYDDIAMLAICKAIVRESEFDLIEALKAKPYLINETIGACSLLDIAFGWPRGIQILLEAGADAHTHDINFVEDTRSKSIYNSVKLLLQAGCSFSYKNIENCNGVVNGDNMRSLLIGELIKRLKGLWELAKCYLPPDEIPALFINRAEDSTNTMIFDAWTMQLHSKLKQQGITIDPSLWTPHEYWPSVYDYSSFSVQTLQALYDFGFQGVNESDPNGLVPLIAHGWRFRFAWQEPEARQVMDQVNWLISKGADPNQLVPGTSSTVAHHLTHWIFALIEKPFRYQGVSSIVLLKEWKRWKIMILQLTQSLNLSPSSADECICACSLSGCNTISLLLRQAFQCLYLRPSDSCEDPGFWLHETLAFVITWIGEDRMVYQEIIRFFTFDAMGSTHICCVEESVDGHYYKLVKRDKQEVEEILEEEKLGLGDLERLVAEFNEKFDELELPILDFLQGYWYSRMIEFLSERDPYDEEHVVGLREIGVKLEAEEWVIPDRVSLLIRPAVEEIIEA